MSLLFLLLLLVASITHADAFTQEDREMLRSTYIRVEKLETKVEVGFQQIEKRFEQIDKRIEQVDKRIDMVITFMAILAGTFATITAVTIGFAIWDRRTMIRPFEDKDKELAELMKKYNML
ncbi:hypothetical protein [Pampinifervens florentissimum]|uniref:hypothetical protein n=1 Tax=Pampinifervens florentissimum TaxID=1632019 RepID=UPI0013B494B1|nr:hypothetical protein [Hydrogenobacter sp. T-8]QID33550.1 hypothetical protein G3M65_07095 [Hydrogenobacter sp. T-8]